MPSKFRVRGKTISNKCSHHEVYDIQASLNEYMKTESLTGGNQWFCYCCDAMRDATRTFAFAGTPDVVIVQLKRFFCATDGTLHKNVIPIAVNSPITLEVQDRSSTSTVSFHCNYDLRACISHEGDLFGGHNIARVKLGRKWYKCNDSAVTISSSLSRMQIDAYILFFVRNHIQASDV
jgi:ubiquitin C-terminal hydrolase